MCQFAPGGNKYTNSDPDLIEINSLVLISLQLLRP